MHPFYLSTLADEHRAHLRAEATARPQRRPGEGPWSWIVSFLRRADHPGPPEGTRLVPEVVVLAPVLVMAPPFPPTVRAPRPGTIRGAAEDPVELAS